MAGAAGAPTAQLGSVDKPGSSGPDYVLLTMDQSAVFRGAQSHAGCTGTSAYIECEGNSRTCQSYGYCNCNSATTYGGTIRYCVGWSQQQSAPGTCVFMGEKICTTTTSCLFTAPEFQCMPYGTPIPIMRNDDVCDTGAPYTPPEQSGN